jgi:hypothetical protein
MAIDLAVSPPMTERLSEPQALAGTLPYMDLHAAGLVLHEMVTGRYPFADVDNSQLIGAILRRPPRPPSASASWPRAEGYGGGASFNSGAIS